MSDKMTKKKLKGKAPFLPSAIHGTDGTTHVVGIGNIKVIICQDEEAWFAQGLDIDYAANGNSLESVKLNFEMGLKGTIDLHIKAFGHIKKFLKVAPQEVWDELRGAGTGYRYTQVSFHEDISKALGGYQGINFIEPELVA